MKQVTRIHLLIALNLHTMVADCHAVFVQAEGDFANETFAVLGNDESAPSWTAAVGFVGKPDHAQTDALRLAHGGMSTRADLRRACMPSTGRLRERLTKRQAAGIPVSMQKAHEGR